MASAAVRDDVLVLGGGAAGIICARVLSLAGLRVQLLEARERLGGRAWAHDALDLGVDVDLGAQWMHCSCVGNPVLRLAKAQGVQIEPDDSDEEVGQTLVMNVASGKVYGWGSENLKKSMRSFTEAEEKVQQSVVRVAGVATCAGVGGANLLEAMEKCGCRLQDAADTKDVGSKASSKKKGKKKGGDDALLRRWAFVHGLGIDEGSTPEELSSTHYADGTELPGGNSTLPKSYGAFVRGLIEGPLDGDLELQANSAGKLEVRCSEPAQSIAWSANGVVVTTCKGTTLEGARAVVTLPLGVLKSGAVSFEPALPTAKECALQRLGVAAMTKILLRFPKKFWRDDLEVFYLCGISLDNENVAGEALFENAEIGLYDDSLPEGSVPAGEGILYLLIVGPAARVAESMTDSELAAAAASVFRRAVGNCNGPPAAFDSKCVPEPSHVAVSRWLSDPYSQGCWVKFPPGSSGEDCRILAEPVGEGRRLSFAGEATTLEDAGTVHGALLTGLREAEAVLMACVSEGRFEGGQQVAQAVRWMMWCRELNARASSLREYNEEDDSSSDGDSSSS